MRIGTLKARDLNADAEAAEARVLDSLAPADRERYESIAAMGVEASGPALCALARWVTAAVGTVEAAYDRIRARMPANAATPDAGADPSRP